MRHILENVVPPKIAKLVLIEGRGKISWRVAPTAALQREHVEPRGGQTLCHNRAGPTEAYQQRVDGSHRFSSGSIPADRRWLRVEAGMADHDGLQNRDNRSALRETRSASSPPCRGFPHREDRQRSLRWCFAAKVQRKPLRQR